MMQTYLGNNPDLSEALEFLSIAEGGEVVHYEGLDSLARVQRQRFSKKDKINSYRRKEPSRQMYTISKAKCIWITI